MIYSLRAEQHERYSPSRGEGLPASQCLRCCDPGTSMYPATAVPQINITILKGQTAAKTSTGVARWLCANLEEGMESSGWGWAEQSGSLGTASRGRQAVIHREGTGNSDFEALASLQEEGLERGPQGPEQEKELRGCSGPFVEVEPVCLALGIQIPLFWHGKPPVVGGWGQERKFCQVRAVRTNGDCARGHSLKSQGSGRHRIAPLTAHVFLSLLGEKGDRGDRGLQGKYGKTGSAGARGHTGPKGQKGSMGAPGERCKSHYAAFSVGRKKPMHSNHYYQTVIFDTEFVNLYGHFNMFTGKFYCYVPGIYFFSLNVHTWNQKETYLHIMKNEEEVVILFAQVGDRSIMQSQSLMLELQEQDQVWVRLYKGERENAIFSDELDTYIIFSGYLVKHASEP
ncbi:hypothetical protein P7K49_011954 [Saguinus oedipus]|uniref:C1q domain-containing protein n=1 Tax=Saguinus oedipus TaxID=9490 RepID=A0ABQ9VVN1_SAGOE|nr:hypothetical protein P7K49_011954 [Saguinus oedipus]